MVQISVRYRPPAYVCTLSGVSQAWAEEHWFRQHLVVFTSKSYFELSVYSYLSDDGVTWLLSTKKDQSVSTFRFTSITPTSSKPLVSFRRSRSLTLAPTDRRRPRPGLGAWRPLGGSAVETLLGSLAERAAFGFSNRLWSAAGGWGASGECEFGFVIWGIERITEDPQFHVQKFRHAHYMENKHKMSGY